MNRPRARSSCCSSMSVVRVTSSSRASRSAAGSPRPTASSRFCSAARCWASRRPTDPKSSRARRPSASSRTLPGCGSAWYAPPSVIWYTMLRSSALVSSARSSPRSSISGPAARRLTPSSHSMTSTCSVLSSSCRAGITTGTLPPTARCWAGQVAAMTAMLRPPPGSRVLPAWRRRIPRATPAAPTARAQGARFSSVTARRCRMSRSCSTVARIPGRCTFTATSAPGPSSQRSRALCTWAIDAAAAGFGSSSAKTCAVGTPSDWVITSSTCSHGAGSARS